MTSPTPIQDPIGLQLAKLAARFPSGATATVLETDRREIEKLGLGLDLPEAVQRILHTRETRTYPPLAEILRRCREAGVDRMKARDDVLRLESGQQPFDSASQEYIRVQRDLGTRGLYWCGRQREFVEGICKHGVRCVDPTPSLEQCRLELDWCEKNGLEPIEREDKTVKGFTRVGELV